MGDFKNITQLCRDLRKKIAEMEFWQMVRNRKINGLKFFRQHPIIYQRFDTRKEFFIADFYCAERKLIIEFDGSSHNSRVEEDKERDKTIKEMGKKVVRFKNSEVRKAIEFVKGL